MSYQQLSQQERYTIKALLKTGITLTNVAQTMGRHKSTISRELRRNIRPSGYYAASVAHSYATARRRSTRRGTHFTNDQWRIVLNLIRHDYSPEQASNIIKTFFDFSISHETIYQYILYDKKKGGSIVSANFTPYVVKNQ